MLRVTSALMLLAALACRVALAQAPTGIITGTLTDESGAVIPNAIITLTNKATGVARTLTTNAGGLYSAPALPAGDYEVKAEVGGFRTVVRDATVQAGETTTVNLPMTLGEARQVVTVEAATAQINYDTHNIQGVIQQSSIQDLPLNGRSYMQLAALEPGVTIASGSTAQFNSLFTVNVLGSGNRTTYTIDGGNVSDNIDTAGGTSSMNFSQDNIQEFQLSELNFDLSTGIASGGAINVVTRSGSNDWHGSAYFYFRDHNMAAYPGLQRSLINPNPFFVRRDPGAWLGGPIKREKVFFFFNFEHMNQVQAINVQGNVPSFSPLTGVFGSPYSQKLITARFDYHFSKHAAFLRYSHDGNNGFGQVFTFGNPSNWVHNTNWADQAIVGLTSVLSTNIVNDARFQYMYWNNHNLQSVPSDCTAPCIGVGLPSIFTVVGSNFPAIGPNFNAPQGRNTRRYEVNDTLSWQQGTHRLRFGGDSNRAISAGLWGFCTPMCAGVYSPEFVRGIPGIAPLFPNLPTSIHSSQDILNLPVLNLASSIFSGVGVGSVSTPAPYDYSDNRSNNQYRVYFQDTWKLRPNLTFNYGLAWNAQTGFYNSDLQKPQFLAPIFGANNLGATPNNWKEFQPALGFAWSPGKSQKWVIRGGAGIYWDSTPGYYKLREPSSIGPVGDGRSTLAASAFTNTIPGILNLSAGGAPIPVGAALPLGALTTMTLGQFVSIVNQELPGIQAKIAPPNVQRSGPYTTSNIDLTKQGVEIYPPSFPMARTYQTSLGVQRDLGHDMVITVDWARRQGENVSIGERDLNLSARYINGVASPVIPSCTPSQLFVAGIECSSGTITVWTDQGRSIYEGMLLKFQKRLTHRYQFVVSYALQNENTDVGNIWNELNWMAGYGPAQGLPRHNLTVAGSVNLPWGFDLSVNSTIQSRTPFAAQIPNIALSGTDIVGTGANSAQALPGLPYDCLGISCSKSDLAKAVASFNTTYAGTKDSKGNVVPTLVLPTDYQFGDPTFSQDFRLTKVFTIKERWHFNMFGEVFNAFNIANLSGYAFNLDTQAAPGKPQTFTFGQPTSRIGQVFGSGGPRAFQVGARFSF